MTAIIKRDDKQVIYLEIVKPVLVESVVEFFRASTFRGFIFLFLNNFLFKSPQKIKLCEVIVITKPQSSVSLSLYLSHEKIQPDETIFYKWNLMEPWCRKQLQNIIINDSFCFDRKKRSFS